MIDEAKGPFAASKSKKYRKTLMAIAGIRFNLPKYIRRNASIT